MAAARIATAIGRSTPALVALCVLAAPVVAASATGVDSSVTGVAPPSTPADVDAAPSGADPGATTADATIDLTQELRLTPTVPGEISVTLRYRVPTAVVGLRTRLPPGATVTATDGFVPDAGSEYAWDRRTDAPSITYRIAANETGGETGPIGSAGEYAFADAGPWALVRVPPTATGWSRPAGVAVEVSRRVTTAGPGAAGDAVAFLGDHREVTRTAHGQTVRLVIPSRATLAEPPERILDSMAAASDTLRVGDRDPEVFVVAAPTGSVRWGARGLQTGDAAMWVRDDEPLDSPHNVWLHEYVHARQAYAAGRDARWFTEATASYYAALLTLQQGLIGFEAFRARLALGARPPDASAELADPATWVPTVPYTKGALVAGDLDRRLRLATDRRQSLQAVFARVNAHDGPVSGDVVTDAVRGVGGDDVAALSDRHTTTAAVPAAWNRSAHERAFGPTPARFEYGLPPPSSADGVRVSGPYRNGSLGAARPIRLATDETLAVDVRVTNVGGTTGTYDARLLVENRSTATQSGELGPNESTTLTFTHRFTSPGEYALTVGGDRVVVAVDPPATPTVAGLDATTVRRQDGTGVTVTARVSNPAPVPAAGPITLQRNGTPVGTVRVAVAPGEERSVAFAETVVGPGRHVFRVGTRTVSVTVPASTRSPTPSTSTRGGGFGSLPALAALLATLFVALGRGRD